MPDDFPTVHRLHLVLEDVEPEVWRRVEVSSQVSLRDLHRIFQAAMGWEDYHLYSFEVRGLEYGEEDPDGWLEFRDPGIRLREVAPVEGVSFRYTYDFGDEWVHRVTVEGVGPAEADTAYPRLLDGARACPPEDSGGPWGYTEILDALADPDHDEHDRWRVWVGEDFDPSEWDREEARRRLESEEARPDPSPEALRRRDEALRLVDRMAPREELPDDVREEAADLLSEYTRLEPDALIRSKKPAIWAAAAVHAAYLLTDHPFADRPPMTLKELAAQFGVSVASVSNRGLELRDCVFRPGPLEQVWTLVLESRSTLLHQVAGDTDPGALLRSFAGTGAPEGHFDRDAFARDAGLSGTGVTRLRVAFREGIDRYDGEVLGRAPADDLERHRPDAERLRQVEVLGYAIREALRAGSVSGDAKAALARRVLTRLAESPVLPGGDVPPFALLSVAHLARRGELVGRALLVAVRAALNATADAGAGIGVDEAGDLLRAVGTDEELEEVDRADTLFALVERSGWGRDGGRVGPEVVEALAGEEAIPEEIRRDVLNGVAGLDDRPALPGGIGPATRRRALVLRCRMEERPERLVEPLLDDGEADETVGLAAAEILEADGDGLDRDELERIVRKGLEADRAAVRQAFFGVGRRFFGGRAPGMGAGGRRPPRRTQCGAGGPEGRPAEESSADVAILVGRSDRRRVDAEPLR